MAKAIRVTASLESVAFDHLGVIGRARSQRRDESGERGASFKKVEVRGTAAIGRAEAKRRRVPAKRPRRLGPQTFSAQRVVTEPNGLQRGALPQVVDVPARPSRRPAVVAQAARDAAGAEGAADVERPAWRQRQWPLADENGSRIDQPEQ